YTANSKPIAAAAEGEGAAAGRATDDPAALVDRKRNAAAIGVRALEADAKQGDQRDQSASKQDRNSHALTLSLSVITGLPAPRVKSLAKSNLTLVECRPNLALVECFRMVLEGLTASCYAAGLHCPCKSTPSPKPRDPSPAPTYPYERRQAILYLWRPLGLPLLTAMALAVG